MGNGASLTHFFTSSTSKNLVIRSDLASVSSALYQDAELRHTFCKYFAEEKWVEGFLEASIPTDAKDISFSLPSGGTLSTSDAGLYQTMVTKPTISRNLSDRSISSTRSLNSARSNPPTPERTEFKPFLLFLAVAARHFQKSSERTSAKLSEKASSQKKPAGIVKTLSGMTPLVRAGSSHSILCTTKEEDEDKSVSGRRIMAAMERSASSMSRSISYSLKPTLAITPEPAPVSLLRQNARTFCLEAVRALTSDATATSSPNAPAAAIIASSDAGSAKHDLTTAWKLLSGRHWLPSLMTFLDEELAFPLVVSQLMHVQHPAGVDSYQSVVVFANKAFENLTKFTRDQLLHKDLLTLIVDPKVSEKHQVDALRAATMSRKPANLGVTMKKKTGATFFDLVASRAICSTTDTEPKWFNVTVHYELQGKEEVYPEDLQTVDVLLHLLQALMV